jgi:hypothetical protein
MKYSAVTETKSYLEHSYKPALESTTLFGEKYSNSFHFSETESTLVSVLSMSRNIIYNLQLEQVFYWKYPMPKSKAIPVTGRESL